MEGFNKKFVVTLKDTASAIGSGDLEILATPAMLAMVEKTCKEYLHGNLAEEETSVGTMITGQHLHPSKVGTEITVNVTIESQKKSRINFSFEVYNKEILIATGEHQRKVVLKDAFLNKYVFSDT